MAFCPPFLRNLFRLYHLIHHLSRIINESSTSVFHRAAARSRLFLFLLFRTIAPPQEPSVSATRRVFCAPFRPVRTNQKVCRHFFVTSFFPVDETRPGEISTSSSPVKVLETIATRRLRAQGSVNKERFDYLRRLIPFSRFTKPLVGEKSAATARDKAEC